MSIETTTIGSYPLKSPENSSAIGLHDDAGITICNTEITVTSVEALSKWALILGATIVVSDSEIDTSLGFSGPGPRLHKVVLYRYIK